MLLIEHKGFMFRLSDEVQKEVVLCQAHLVQLAGILKAHLKVWQAMQDMLKVLQEDFMANSSQ